jgi:hypothetical protein
MAPYVRWRTGAAYGNVHLLSLRDVARLPRGGFTWRIAPPSLWEGDIRRFAPAKRALARSYNRLVTHRLVRTLLLPIAPLFEIVGARTR